MYTESYIMVDPERYCMLFKSELFFIEAIRFGVNIANLHYTFAYLNLYYTPLPQTTRHILVSVLKAQTSHLPLNLFPSESAATQIVLYS